MIMLRIGEIKSKWGLRRYSTAGHTHWIGSKLKLCIAARISLEKTNTCDIITEISIC